MSINQTKFSRPLLSKEHFFTFESIIITSSCLILALSKICAKKPTSLSVTGVSSFFSILSSNLYSDSFSALFSGLKSICTISLLNRKPNKLVTVFSEK